MAEISVEQGWKAKICADLLDQGKTCHLASLLVTAFVILGAFSNPDDTNPYAIAAWSLVVLLGFAQMVFAVRVGFDGALLRLIGEGRLDLSVLDKSLSELGLLRAEKSGRTLDERLKGCVRLLKLQMLCLALQLAAVFLGGVCVFAFPTLVG